MTYIYIPNIDAVHKWQKYTIFHFIPGFHLYENSHFTHTFT